MGCASKLGRQKGAHAPGLTKCHPMHRSSEAKLEAMPRRLSPVRPGDIDAVMECIMTDFVQHAYFVTGKSLHASAEQFGIC
jgi:hypothetical protein